MVLIDDGWQSIFHDDDSIGDKEGINRTCAGEQMPCRLVKHQENYKFREYGSSRSLNDKGMGAFVRDIKEDFKSIEHVYVWHALCGYWGGIRPNVQGMPPAKVITPKLSQGLKMTMEDLAVDKIVNNGGISPTRSGRRDVRRTSFSSSIRGNRWHQTARDAGEEYGGRVELAKSYYNALTASKGMALSLAWNTAMTSSSSEQRPFHLVVSVMISGALTPQEIQTGRIGFRAATWFIAPTTACGWGISYTRIGTCSNQLTDVPSSTPRLELYLYTGVQGLFNCQGVGWCRESPRNESVSQFSAMVGCFASPKTSSGAMGRTLFRQAVPASSLYTCSSRKLMLMNHQSRGGAILSMVLEDDENVVRIGVKGSGNMRVYASERPMVCKIDGTPVEFEYDDQMITVHVPWPNSSSLSTVEYLF
ncbi:hypothetical protein F3Y22_tig00112988pilonHSYRG00151 [Hibiscus syriacus]|uniref:Galactinol--sucrose galactosyltransferase n=1 Tax=Hibiscus syriacus TaxID=106335 RepID=A0A6A2XXL6_HIBSY|nr:hypothetical protein F3Y22_tig00112988pilonHSYRG00151 [Hibiscus syriacus]